MPAAFPGASTPRRRPVNGLFVLCLGVLHKFRPDDYRGQVTKLANLTRETLVLEVLADSRATQPIVHNDGGLWPWRTILPPQTLIGWLAGENFQVTEHWQSTRHPERYFFIAERTKA